ncbi:MAG: hypothetical protein ABSE71_04395 [Candidatus Micrarchaeaceae archaeon]|jgi:hypothetical protein|nr:hypothetical protein [Candidatus Micrarchaeota archaeon]HII09760.1 hypothetical protein [Candidatus Micrarchaeota archaeon]
MERLLKKTDTLVMGTPEHATAVAWNNVVRDIASHMRMLNFVQVDLVSERHGVTRAQLEVIAVSVADMLIKDGDVTSFDKVFDRYIGPKKLEELARL